MLSLFWVRLCLGKTHACAELLAMHLENRWAFFSLALIGTNECSGSSRRWFLRTLYAPFRCQRGNHLITSRRSTFPEAALAGWANGHTPPRISLNEGEAHCFRADKLDGTQEASLTRENSFELSASSREVE